MIGSVTYYDVVAIFELLNNSGVKDTCRVQRIHSIIQVWHEHA